MTDQRGKNRPVPGLETPSNRRPVPLEPLLPGGPARIAPEERGALDDFSLAAERAAPAAAADAAEEWISPEGHLVRFVPDERGPGRYAVLLPEKEVSDPALFRLHAGGRSIPFDEKGLAFLPGDGSE